MAIESFVKAGKGITVDNRGAFVKAFSRIKNFVKAGIGIIVDNRGAFVKAFFYILIFLLFREAFMNFLDTVAVVPLLSQVKSDSVSDVVVVLFVIGFIVWNVRAWRRNYIMPGDFVLLLSVVVALYLWYRLYDHNEWIFTGFSFAAVNYLDALCLLLAVPILSFWATVKRAMRTEVRTCEFFEDNPLDKDGDDLLNYRHYAGQLSEKLDKSTFSKAFAIGITGTWGSGKSSFLAMMREYLESKDRIIVDFNPWNAQGVNPTMIDFFNALKSSLKEYHHSLGPAITRYAESLVDAYGNPFLKMFSFLRKDKSLKEQYDEINTLLGKVNRQIIIFIDDLDRLDNDELFDVIKLIRNVANFQNVVFIVAYDRNYVINSIRQVNDYSSEFYLEKIFQMEISVPHFENRIVLDELVKKIIQKIGNEYQKQISGLVYEVRLGAGYKVSKYIENVRDVVRFANLFSFSFEKLRGEVLLDELFKLELLRFKYPSVYWLLYKRPQTFVFRDEIASHYRSSNSLISNVESLDSSKYAIPRGHMTEITDLISDIFPNSPMARSSNNLSIIYPSSFDRYFAIRLFVGDISEVEFSNKRKSDQDTFNSYIQELVDLKRHQTLERRLAKIDTFDDKEDYERIIRGIFYLALSIVKRNNGYYNDIIHIPENLYLKTIDKDRLIQMYDRSELDLRTFLLSNFKMADYPYLVDGYIANRLLEQLWGEPYESLRVVDLESVILDYFRAVTAKETEVSAVFMDAFDNCKIKRSRRVVHGESDSYWIAEAKSLFLDFITRQSLASFYNRFIFKQGRLLSKKKRYTLSRELIDIFGSWEEFEVFMTMHSKGEPCDDEFKKFFLEIKKNNFDERGVPFEFHNLDPSGWA